VTQTATPELTVYMTTWCGYCHRLRRELDRAGIPYTAVDVEQVPDGAALVEQVNGGDRLVPTVVLADGTALSNPSLRQLTAELDRMRQAEQEPTLEA
jgi:mycoredoxin